MVLGSTKPPYEREYVLKGTYLGASSGVEGKDPNVTRIVVSLNKSSPRCQTRIKPSLIEARRRMLGSEIEREVREWKRRMLESNG